jgi:hypothetical protein
LTFIVSEVITVFVSWRFRSTLPDPIWLGRNTHGDDCSHLLYDGADYRELALMEFTSEMDREEVSDDRRHNHREEGAPKISTRVRKLRVRSS